MARPAKSLADRVRSRSFIPSRHGDLLAAALVGPERLREIRASPVQASPTSSTIAGAGARALRGCEGFARRLPRLAERCRRSSPGLLQARAG